MMKILANTIESKKIACGGGVDVATDDSITSQYESLRQSYGTVYPACGDCAGFITKRPKQKKKRAAPPDDTAKPAKKQKSSA